MGAMSEPGLSRAEAERLLVEHGPNLLPPPPPDPWWRKVAKATIEPMSLLLLAAAGVSGFLLGETVDALAITVVVVLNVGIGVAQERRAENALAALSDLQNPMVRVIRDGSPTVIPTGQVVPGDLVILAAGDRVCADITIVRAAGLEIDESTLTGESLPVSKPVGERSWSGTMVTAGSGLGRVDSTGAATRLGRLAQTLTAPRPATPLQRQLARLSLILGLGAIIAAVAFFVAATATTGDWRTGFVAAVALAVAAVPEGLPTAVVLALALGAMRMAHRGAIVRRLAAVETLGSATVILTDKTGTLTENRLRVDRIILGDGTSFEATIPAEIGDLISLVATTCNDAALSPPAGDALDIALLHAFPPPETPLARLLDHPFGSETRRHTVVIDHPGSGLMLLTKGAPETVIEICDTFLDPSGAPAPLTRTGISSILDRVETESSRGHRVIALALRRLERAPERIDRMEDGLTLVGLLTMGDPVRSSAPATVAAAHRAGIEVIMVTGDHPGTATAIAAQAGVKVSSVITGSELRRWGLPDDPRRHSVYARVEPEQKLAIVEALRRRGEVVAMKGDGVNDAPALRAADIGVAMGSGGTEVARQAADLVLTDDDLETVVAAIGEGRVIYDNIRKVVEYLVGGNLSELAVVAAALLLIPAIPIPLLPLQLLFINLVTDGLPALALGVDPPSAGLMDQTPRPQGEAMLTRARLALLLGRGLVMASGPLAIGYLVSDHPERARSAMFATLVIVHLGYAQVVRAPRGAANRLLDLAIGMGVGLLGLVMAVAPLRRLLGVSLLTPATGLGILVASAIPLAALFGWEALRQRRAVG